jgi:GT2 family glycosyltransferase
VSPTLTLDVVVPSYHRPDELARCLEGLARQTRPADHVVVVLRDDDDASRVVCAQATVAPVVVTVHEPGQTAAINAGVAASTGEAFALTDDDAVPHDDWLARIDAAFRASPPEVAGVGGRDMLHRDGQLVTGAAERVGIVQFTGRLVGNHHIGVGGPRDVHVLKGANCAYRRAAFDRVGMDLRLRGTGAQVHQEVALGFGLRRLGYRLRYDPAILVDHFEAKRMDVERISEGARAPLQAMSDATYNLTFILMQHFPRWQRVLHLVWADAVGTRNSPGVVQAVRFARTQRMVALHRLTAAHRARVQAVRAAGAARASATSP